MGDEPYPTLSVRILSIRKAFVRCQSGRLADPMFFG